MKPLLLLIPATLLTCVSVANAGAVEQLINEYSNQTNINFSADTGKSLWSKIYKSDKEPRSRSCASCHTENLRIVGQHVKTKKSIDPLAPSENSQRLTEMKTIEKWFLRNCKWTVGRECTAEEKGHFLKFISAQ
jgi:hypothetical protein